MKNLKELRYVHNLMWIGHGILSMLCGLMIMGMESFVTEMMQNEDVPEDAKFAFEFLEYFFNIADEVIIYGIAVTVLTTIYHFKPNPLTLPMYLLIIIHVPLSIMVCLGITEMGELDYSIIVSIIGSELTLIACLVLSWIYVMRRQAWETELAAKEAGESAQSDEALNAE